MFQTRDIRIVVSNESLVFIPLNDSDELLTRIESAARHILTTLSHTPIQAVGENFLYTVDRFADPLAKVLEFRDADQLSAEGKIDDVSLVRTINLEKCQLNLKLARGFLPH